jgi:hypothetical protein
LLTDRLRRLDGRQAPGDPCLQKEPGDVHALGRLHLLAHDDAPGIQIPSPEGALDLVVVGDRDPIEAA